MGYNNDVIDSDNEEEERLTRPFLIHVRFLKSPAYLGYRFTSKNTWMVDATGEEEAMDKLEVHLRSFLIDEPEVGDHMMLDMSSVTIL